MLCPQGGSGHKWESLRESLIGLARHEVWLVGSLEFQDANVSGFGVLENGLISSSEHESLRPSLGDQKTISRVTVRLAWQESAFRCSIRIQG